MGGPEKKKKTPTTTLTTKRAFSQTLHNGKKFFKK
jgi:hypothetical protein